MGGRSEVLVSSGDPPEAEELQLCRPERCWCLALALAHGLEQIGWRAYKQKQTD